MGQGGAQAVPMAGQGNPGGSSSIYGPNIMYRENQYTISVPGGNPGFGMSSTTDVAKKNAFKFDGGAAVTTGGTGGGTDATTLRSGSGVKVH